MGSNYWMTVNNGFEGCWERSWTTLKAPAQNLLRKFEENQEKHSLPSTEIRTEHLWNTYREFYPLR
jgi:hypothetical protein